MNATRWFAWATGLALLLVLTSWATPTMGSASAGSADFESAVEAYRAGDLATAEVLFDGLLDAGLSASDRAILLRNLGNIAYRQDEFMDAVAYYTAATREESRDGDLWHNLELARASAGLEPADAGDLAATAAHLFSLPTAAELRTAGWLLVGLLALVLLVEVLRGGTSPKVAAGLVVFALAGDLALLQVRSMTALEAPAMVVAADGVELSSEPRPGYPAGIDLEPAEVVEVIDRLGQQGQAGAWVKVQSAEGQGWLPESEVLSW